MNKFDVELDATNLNCPIPILKAKKAVLEMSPGQVIKIIATDPGSIKDFKAFCKQTGHELLSSDDNGSIYTYFIQIKG